MKFEKMIFFGKDLPLNKCIEIWKKVLITVIIIILISIYIIVNNFQEKSLKKQKKFQPNNNDINLMQKFGKINEFNYNEKTVMKKRNFFNSIEKKSNIAINYINEWKKLNKIRNDWIEYNGITCNTTVPSVDELDYNNIHWQTVSNNKGIGYHLYNAYYDNRGDNKTIRIMASRVNRVKIKKLRYYSIFSLNFMHKIL